MTVKTATKPAAPRATRAKAAPAKTAAAPAAKAPVKPAVKLLVPKVAEAKHIGSEPTWDKIENRKSQVVSAFNWYNYSYGTKDAKEMIVDYLVRNDRAREAKLVQAVADNEMRTVIGWLCRMSVVGLELDERELTEVNKDIARLVATKAEKKKTAAEKAADKPSIQDRLREKLVECAGEMEGMYDEFLQAGCKMSADFKPLNLIRQFNVAPPLVGEISKIWEKKLAELKLLQAGKDKQLNEGYAVYGKLQVRNMIKFAEQVVADCAAYVQIKKVERKPRAKKPVSAEKVVSKLKYQREDTTLNIKSEPVVKIHGASELWLYDTKKRKLQHYVADSHIGSLTVKGTAIIGFDATASTQKTLRNPAEQLKQVMGSRPAARKNYTAIKAVETKLTGRTNENILILKVY